MLKVTERRFGDFKHYFRAEFEYFKHELSITKFIFTVNKIDQFEQNIYIYIHLSQS